jgi:hypothetical protein
MPVIASTPAFPSLRLAERGEAHDHAQRENGDERDVHQHERE